MIYSTKIDLHKCHDCDWQSKIFYSFLLCFHFWAYMLYNMAEEITNATTSPRTICCKRSLIIYLKRPLYLPKHGALFIFRDLSKYHTFAHIVVFNVGCSRHFYRWNDFWIQLFLHTFSSHISYFFEKDFLFHHCSPFQQFWSNFIKIHQWFCISF